MAREGAYLMAELLRFLDVWWPAIRIVLAIIALEYLHRIAKSLRSVSNLAWKELERGLKTHRYDSD